MNIINVSNKDEYYTQRNNKHTPLISCFPTSMVALLDYRDIPMIAPDGMEVQVNEFQNIYNRQPEDYLTELLCSKKAIEFYEDHYKKKAINYKQRYNYRTVAWVVNNLLCKKEVVKYQKMSLKKILFLLLNDRPSVIGGSFTPAGHIVCLVGFVTEQKKIKSYKAFNMNLITHVIIDDPYGDYNTRYKNVKGNNIQIKLDVFNKLTNNNWNKKYIIM